MTVYIYIHARNAVHMYNVCIYFVECTHGTLYNVLIFTKKRMIYLVQPGKSYVLSTIIINIAICNTSTISFVNNTTHVYIQ